MRRVPTEASSCHVADVNFRAAVTLHAHDAGDLILVHHYNNTTPALGHEPGHQPKHHHTNRAGAHQSASKRAARHYTSSVRFTAATIFSVFGYTSFSSAGE